MQTPKTIVIDDRINYTVFRPSIGRFLAPLQNSEPGQPKCMGGRFMFRIGSDFWIYFHGLPGLICGYRFDCRMVNFIY